MTTPSLANSDASLLIPAGYKEFLEEIKTRIREAQIRASLSVNKELVLLYWSIGKSILEKQALQGWGSKIIDRMAQDLTVSFPGVSGFSIRNLKYMRKLADVYPDSQFVQAVLAQLPWWHNLLILEKLKDPESRTWYAHEVLKNGWSGRALEEAIRSNLYGRKGKAITNFQERLPAPHAQLVNDILKSPYNFGFLTLEDDYVEQELERGLVANLEQLLLELGQGFAFIGRQYHIEIAGDDYYLDMLFYHVKLRCFCVVELKTTDFKPEYAGKLNMAKPRKKSETSIPEKIKYEISSGNIFADFGYENPKEANAKSDLALLINAIIKHRKLTQTRAAGLMKIDQPKVSKIMRGLLSEFTIERLMHCLLGLGCDLEIKPTLGKAAIPSIHVSKNANLKRQI